MSSIQSCYAGNLKMKAHLEVQFIDWNGVPETEVAAVAGLPARDGVVIGSSIHHIAWLPVTLDAGASELDLMADGPCKLPWVACMHISVGARDAPQLVKGRWDAIIVTNH
jgi:hypothetical protein